MNCISLFFIVSLWLQCQQLISLCWADELQSESQSQSQSESQSELTSRSRSTEDDPMLSASMLRPVAGSESESESKPGLRRRLSEAETDEEYRKRLASHVSMFEPVANVRVLGPTKFPKPTDRLEYIPVDPNDTIVPYMTPYHGKHRPEKDAVFAYAAEYDLHNFVCFVQSLHNTGFDGDIVISISELDIQNAKIWEYLKSVPNLVIYVPKLVCFNFEREEVASAKGGIRTCQCHDLYGFQHQNGTITPMSDPRPDRVIATIRYEIYWILAQNYKPQSWILLVDARDAFFQSDPFHHVPRQTDPTAQSGLLYFFGENIEATRIGKSKSNAKWILSAYGDRVARALANKPTICSGATMGEQVAIETYARAIAAESDDTGTVLMGADQGFHNFLYYSNKLKNADTIHDIVVFDQGTGIVNNMGALRTQPLKEWGNGKIIRHVPGNQYEGDVDYEVLNWDGTLSAVVHQFDRHAELSEYFFKKKTHQLLAEWRKSLSAKT